MPEASHQAGPATDRQPRWAARYAEKCVTADEALSVLESGMRVDIHPGCAVPETLVEAMMCLVLADHWLRQRSVDVLPARS